MMQNASEMGRCGAGTLEHGAYRTGATGVLGGDPGAGGRNERPGRRGLKDDVHTIYVTAASAADMPALQGAIAQVRPDADVTSGCSRCYR